MSKETTWKRAKVRDGVDIIIKEVNYPKKIDSHCCALK